jgi:hypothetical protein
VAAVREVFMKQLVYGVVVGVFSVFFLWGLNVRADVSSRLASREGDQQVCMQKLIQQIELLSSDPIEDTAQK